VCRFLLLVPFTASAQSVRPEVIATFPHDPEAFTQGLVLHGGKFFESTGLLGRSTLRRVTLATGEVEQSVALPDDHFGEGLALAGDRLIQLTWQNQVAFVYDLDFDATNPFGYEGEGWGLCYDGEKLVMSDGSSRLTFRDAVSFEVIGGVDVLSAGEPVTALNELECVGDLVYANVWLTDTIVRIDAATGGVLTTIDASGLLTPQEAAAADVLNGIAFDAATEHFYLTGKLWPKLFEVRFPFEPGGSEPDSGTTDASVSDAGDETGTSVDASTPSEAASDGAADASDAAHAGDAGAAGNETTSSGCGCRLAPRVVSTAPALLALLLFGLLRRRACRAKAHFGTLTGSSTTA
jgi:glutaminyl-peptide cyclotransferase